MIVKASKDYIVYARLFMQKKMRLIIKTLRYGCTPRGEEVIAAQTTLARKC